MSSLEVVDTTREIVNMRVRGKDFSQIADKLGMTAARAREKFLEYMHEAYADSDEVELRFLQLKRMEKMIDFLWDQVAAGDALSEGKQTANMIKVIEEINKLMGLHRDHLKDAQVKLTEAQTAQVYEVMASMRTGLLDKVLEGVRPETRMMEASQAERLRSVLESHWAGWYERSVGEAVVLIDANEGTGTT